MRVLIVPDKFKGTLTAQAAAQLIAQGWNAERPEDALELVPMSDGGDGFGEVLSHLAHSELHLTDTVDAAHRPRAARWWWNKDDQQAVIESAQVIGLALLPPGRYHPFDLDTSGLGAVLMAAHEIGARRCLVGIGGSATNDGGFGLARALGWTFQSGAGAPILRWTDLDQLVSVRPPERSLLMEVTVAVDVQNPLLGPTGASRVYGPQKGLQPENMPKAEACLGALARVMASVGRNVASEAGTGAAGGLGFGLRAFLNGKLESGFALFAQAARLEERIARADLVITAEGAIDASTLMGKGVGEVAALCGRGNVPCLGLAGTLAEADTRAGGFHRCYGMTPQLTSPELAKAQPAEWLPRLATLAAREWNS
jgi:glycerate 2-kinase